MRARTLSILIVFALATVASAKDVYLSVGGSVGVFRTDARIFNPSTTKDIQIQAYYLPIGNSSNAAVQPVTITVPKRQMADYDDVVASLFHSSGVGAIRLSCADDFVATQRIYAQASNGTLGQFVPGLDVSTAQKNGVLIQLKSSAAFHTNLGAVNPNNSAANVTWRLYDKNNVLVATGSAIAMPPFAVINATSMASTFFWGAAFNAATMDLSDSWVSYASDQPIFAYASVVDNGTTDPTFIPASADSGGTAAATTPAPNTFDVAVSTSAITISPALTGLNVGDQVTFHVHTLNAGHGFQLTDPNGQVVIADRSGAQGFDSGASFDQTFTISGEGTFTYFCTRPTCSSGHSAMIGTFNVGSSSTPEGPKY
jgi:plastocyanin